MFHLARLKFARKLGTKSLNDITIIIVTLHPLVNGVVSIAGAAGVSRAYVESDPTRQMHRVEGDRALEGLYRFMFTFIFILLDA